MARQYHEIRGLAIFASKMIVSEEQEWQKFLESAGNLYKYPFKEQMLIYAQRPDATACASLELWNEQMHCWVNKGAKGIALIDKEGVHRSGLKYVFDVSDVHEARFIGHRPRLWQMKEEYKETIIDSLERIYGETEAGFFEDKVKEIAERIAAEMAPDIVSEQLSQTVEGSFLEGFDDLNLELRLCDTIRNRANCLLMEKRGNFIFLRQI